MKKSQSHLEGFMSKGVKSNHDSKESSDKSHLSNTQTYPTEKNVGGQYKNKFIRKSKETFKKGMHERDVKISLFLIEGQDDFEIKSLRSKMTEVICVGDADLQSWFYEKGLEDDLPKTWEDFKDEIINFCTGKSLCDIKKFKDETWLQFLERCEDFINIRNIKEQQLLDYLRKQYLPRNIRILLYTNDISLSSLKRNARDQEYFYRINKKDIGESKSFFSPSIRTQKHKKEIICYACGNEGHFARDCTNKKIYQTISRESQKTNIDYKKALLNGKEQRIILDTGADRSLVCSGALELLGKEKINFGKNTFRLIDGRNVISKRYLDMTVDFDGFSKKLRFWVIENNTCKDIVLGNDFINEYEKKEKYFKIPIECRIDTPDNDRVSWSRPIRSFRDKQDFEKLIQELEEKGIVEESTSQWCNPVVLRRKKDGRLRFCVDFR